MYHLIQRLISQKCYCMSSLTASNMSIWALRRALAMLQTDLSVLLSKAPRNCWLALNQEQTALVGRGETMDEAVKDAGEERCARPRCHVGPQRLDCHGFVGIQVKKSYTRVPLDRPNPAFKSETAIWIPLLNVRVGTSHAQTPKIPVVVDSGSQCCLFRTDVAEYLGIDVSKGIEDTMGGTESRDA